MPKRTVSCQQCRLRKVKCDRGHPCSQCTADPENPRVCRYGAFNQQAQPQPFVPAAGAAPQPQLAGGMGDANMPLLDPLPPPPADPLPHGNDIDGQGYNLGLDDDAPWLAPGSDNLIPEYPIPAVVPAAAAATGAPLPAPQREMSSSMSSLESLLANPSSGSPVDLEGHQATTPPTPPNLGECVVDYTVAPVRFEEVAFIFDIPGVVEMMGGWGQFEGYIGIILDLAPVLGHMALRFIRCLAAQGDVRPEYLWGALPDEELRRTMK